MPQNTTGAKRVPTDRVRRVELLISNLLRFGVVASFLLIVAGTTVSFIRHPAYAHAPQEMHDLTAPGANFPRTFDEIAAGAAHLRGRAWVTIGLLVLLATPVARVAVSIVAFAIEKDRAFVVITSTVLALLLLSFALGKVTG